MHLTLTERETVLLSELLRDYLPALQREVARTEQHELRHGLIERQDLVERLLRIFEGSGPAQVSFVPAADPR